MRSAASKTKRTLQLDLPFDHGLVDPPSSVHSVSSASRTEVTLDVRNSFVVTPKAGQPDRPLSFPTEHERVVATLLEERSRETKLPAGIDTDTNRNLAATELSVEAVPEVSTPSDPTTFPVSPAGRILDGSWSSTTQDTAGTRRLNLNAYRELARILRGLHQYGLADANRARPGSGTKTPERPEPAGSPPEREQ